MIRFLTNFLQSMTLSTATIRGTEYTREAEEYPLLDYVDYTSVLHSELVRLLPSKGYYPLLKIVADPYQGIISIHGEEEYRQDAYDLMRLAIIKSEEVERNAERMRKKYY